MFRVKPSKGDFAFALGCLGFGIWAVVMICIIFDAAGGYDKMIERNPVAHCKPRGGVLGSPGESVFYCKDGTRWNVTYRKEN